MVKNLSAMQETQVQSLGLEDPLEKGMTTHSSILAWRIPWTEEPGGLWSMGSQRVRYDLPTKQQQTTNAQQDMKRPKRPTATFEKLGAKAGYCTQYHQLDEQTTWVTPSAQPLDTPLPSLHKRNNLTPPQWASRGTCLLISLPPASAGAPSRALPEFLVWPLIKFYWLRRPRTWVHNSMSPLLHKNYNRWCCGWSLCSFGYLYAHLAIFKSSFWLLKLLLHSSTSSPNLL